ncbi:MAG TPA: NADH-quinone oxidoreductase subunit NuoF [Atribacter sp.]|jgi:NADH:ubiquinone oxidoreductase subunit F (NADH-binding)/(2Fe-2S) ferredoxin|uniref:NADP-reducing hydrogenase subunit HndC n=1 Tax=Candidatus Atribacter allofermentans TaxID=1852833 RepID=A0A1V5STZ4_9BACT|nr:NADH-quinone oxidoreductase subunit NuoF [Atribacter sp.]MDD3713304.1 NADH-quinone oxidoreductase subunit NuoF [Atribacterota bacterium]OQA57985.1 MAG: NADP-reducing hydrogenase subunit HndC [Candidatus Atribacteria bacterium ADurb.Bin276]HHT08724.1 NADH-quinone oxidoreductase subunit NuoF [Candidatus Atribacteria bacterium]MDI9595574.1 NADH-quinone oxidoreductase subunit NuoF [Atribacterota bacterium]HQK82351.1 NADH-quinone oxidoreductase subunit NuoF [Atribacter sp.]
MLFRSHVLVEMTSSSVVLGAAQIREKFEKEIERLGLSQEIRILDTGSFGAGLPSPFVVIFPDNVVYAPIKLDQVKIIVEEHLLKGRPVKDFMYSGRTETTPQDFRPLSPLAQEKRVVLRNSGYIDPTNIDDYIARDGYMALGKVLSGTPEEAIQIVKNSGLLGRGGAGYPTGLKWEYTQKAQGDEKYIVCNADEGEPGTFKDRLILEGDPHSILEAMAIAGFAVGAHQGYIYVRGEYPESIRHLEIAISQALDYGLLGDNLLNSGFSFRIDIRKGAGAYICGEETALLESMEGGRGEPRIKPPYPPQKGLWGKPTVINNVETFANIPPIFLNGPEWFKNIGTPTCPGTKVFTLTGNVINLGLIEVPMGTTLRELVYQAGGGIKNGRELKLIQTGGPSGGTMTPDLLDVPMAFDTLPRYQSALGSGALTVIDDTHCIVDVVKNFCEFFLHESCGKCTPCRIGNKRIVEILERISSGKGIEEDLEKLTFLGEHIKRTSFCGLGQAAPNPLLRCLDYFREEFESHVIEKRCPFNVCPMESPKKIKSLKV